MSSTKKIINNQRDETWANLMKRFIANEMSFESILTTNILQYLQYKSKSVGTNMGYILLPLIVSINHILSRKRCKIEVRRDYIIPLNLYGIFVGPPTTGKSSAFKAVITEPYSAVMNEQEAIFSTSTTSGLSKLVSTYKSSFLVNPEISEFILKILKNDDENFSGASQLLCKLFTGEQTTMNYATENNRVIEEDVTFSIIGATQVKSMAHILSMMDNGNGLMDRFIIFVQSSIRPLPEDQIIAKSNLTRYPQQIIMKMYQILENLDEQNPIMFYFNDTALRYFEQYESKMIEEFNKALKEGHPTKKSKTLDLIPRVAVAIHVVEVLFEAICDSMMNVQIPEDISLPTTMRAIHFVESLDEQKEIFSEFLDNISKPTKAVVQNQPSQAEIAKAIMYCPGPVVTFPLYRKFGKASVRKIMKSEFISALKYLCERNCGVTEMFRVERAAHDSLVFIKNSFDDFEESVKELLGPSTSFNERKSKAVHQSIPQSIRDRLVLLNYTFI